MDYFIWTQGQISGPLNSEIQYNYYRTQLVLILQLGDKVDLKSLKLRLPLHNISNIDIETLDLS